MVHRQVTKWQRQHHQLCSDPPRARRLALGSQQQKRGRTRWGDPRSTPHDGGSMIRPTRAWRTAVVLATASLALTACGGNNESGSAGNNGASPSESSSAPAKGDGTRSEEHTSELQSHVNLVCRLLLEKKKKKE